MLWIPLSVMAMAMSAIGTAVIAVRLRLNWDLRISSVRWLLFMLFVYLFWWAIMRCILYIRITLVLSGNFIADVNDDEHHWTPAELDCLGVQSIPHLHDHRTWWVAVVACLGDVALLGVILWLVPLTYELSKLAHQSMDRGPEQEHRKLRCYRWFGQTVIVLFLTAELTLVIFTRGYTMQTHALLLVNYIGGVCAVIYMLSSLAVMKVQGRHIESLQGAFTPSPVYGRLRQIMTIYAVMALPFQISSTLVYASNGSYRPVLELIGASLVIYSNTGLALSIFTGCSQLCMLHLCQPCVPDGFEEELLRRQDVSRNPVGGTIPVTAPLPSPVFVNTDIESSSDLWALAPEGVMQQSIDIHDKIIRSAIASHRGYEVTTRGDSFQIVFHSIKNAMAFCIAVQLQLLVASWPHQLHGIVPATTKKRVMHRTVFRGLRVRMGVHDACEAEGRLVVRPHAVTGRATYTGASEVIAEDVGEAGHGGQIVVTKRVVDWLEDNASQLDVGISIKRMGQLSIRHVDDVASPIEVFDVLPLILIGRRKLWDRRPLSHRLIQEPTWFWGGNLIESQQKP